MEKQLQQAKRTANVWGWLTAIVFVGLVLLAVMGAAILKIAVPWYVWVILPLAIIFLIVAWASKQETYRKLRKEHLMKSGKPATAQLLSSSSTGASSGTSTVMKIRLQLTAASGETWETELRKSLSPDKYYLLAPGTEFKAWYLPENRNEVTIEGLD